MKHKIFALLVLFFVLLPTLVVLADDPTSMFINPGRISTGLGGPASGVAVVVEIWNSAVGGTMLGTEPHTVNTDGSGTITNDTGFGDFELGRGSGGVNPTFFQNAAASPISRYLDVTQAGVSVLPGGTRIPFLTVPFALSVPLIHNFGTDNLFAGVNAGNFALTGFLNTASGAGALFLNTTGNFNTASGFNALHNNTTIVDRSGVSHTGENNTASGTRALFSNIAGSNNTAIGFRALLNNTTVDFEFFSQGDNNTATGANALLTNTVGVNNTATGYNALRNNSFGSSNTAVGANADIIMLDYASATPLTTGNFPWHVIFGLDGSHVTTTICAGKILMRDRVLLSLDEQAIAAKARERAQQVWQRI